MNAAGYTNAGYDGTGVKIGIIDGGFAGYAAKLGTELPASVTTQDFCGGQLTTATDHGTAVAEIVHEVAPGAQLYLICFDTEVDLAAAEAYAKAQGIKIINHSVSWFDTWRGDGGGPAGTPDATVADAKANGILWVNAAGNEAQNHWSGNFVDDGNDDNVFSGERHLQPLHDRQRGEGVCRPQVGHLAVDDERLRPLSRADERRSRQSHVDQRSDGPGGAPPVEEACYTEPGRDTATSASRSSGTQASTRRGSTSSSSDRPDPVPDGRGQHHRAGLVAERARGRRDLLERVRPRAVQLARPEHRRRHQAGHRGFDSVSSSTYGASGRLRHRGLRRHVGGVARIAGAAALFLQQNPTLTPTTLQAKITSFAVDMGTAGQDNLFGAGRLLLPTLPANTSYRRSRVRRPRGRR